MSMVLCVMFPVDPDQYWVFCCSFADFGFYIWQLSGSSGCIRKPATQWWCLEGISKVKLQKNKNFLLGSSSNQDIPFLACGGKWVRKFLHDLKAQEFVITIKYPLTHSGSVRLLLSLKSDAIQNFLDHVNGFIDIYDVVFLNVNVAPETTAIFLLFSQARGNTT